MKKNILATILVLNLFATAIKAQVWLSQNSAFPIPMQGWRITAVDNNTAWTFGYAIDSTYTSGVSAGWSLVNYSFSKTTNGGNLWRNGNFPAVDTGYAINLVALDTSHAWISFYELANGSKVFKTTNGGANWTETNPGMPDFVDFVYFFDIMNGIIVTDPDANDFNIYTTSNGGTSWSLVNYSNIPDIIDPNEYGIIDNFVAKGNKIWFNSTFGRVYFSADKGHNWSVLDAPSCSNPDAFSQQLSVDDSGTVYQAYMFLADSITYTLDSFWLFRRGVNETTWTEITPTNNAGYLSGLTDIPSTTNLILNHTSYDTSKTTETLVSYNKGANWQTIDASPYKRGYVSFLSPTLGYSCEIPKSYNNPSKHIFKYNGSPITGILSPKAIDVTLHIRPNPASDFVDLTIHGSKQDNYWILLNDMNGKLISKTEVNNTIDYNDRFDLRQLASGIYKITVSNKEGAVSQKIIKK